MSPSAAVLDLFNEERTEVPASGADEPHDAGRKMDPVEYSASRNTTVHTYSQYSEIGTRGHRAWKGEREPASRFFADDIDGNTISALWSLHAVPLQIASVQLKWLPKGVLKANPDRYELTEADVERMKASGGIDDGCATVNHCRVARPLAATCTRWELIAVTERSSGSTRRTRRRWPRNLKQARNPRSRNRSPSRAQPTRTS
jgi:hypothetical protein